MRQKPGAIRDIGVSCGDIDGAGKIYQNGNRKYGTTYRISGFDLKKDIEISTIIYAGKGCRWKKKTVITAAGTTAAIHRSMILFGP